MQEGGNMSSDSSSTASEYDSDSDDQPGKDSATDPKSAPTEVQSETSSISQIESTSETDLVVPESPPSSSFAEVNSLEAEDSSSLFEEFLQTFLVSDRTVFRSKLTSFDKDDSSNYSSQTGETSAHTGSQSPPMPSSDGCLKDQEPMNWESGFVTVIDESPDVEEVEMVDDFL